MRKLTIYIVILSFIGMLYYIWGSKVLAPITKAGPTLAIKRLEHELFTCENRGAIITFLKNNPLFTQDYLGITSSEEGKIADQLYSMVQDSAMQALYQEVALTFKDFTRIEKELESAFNRLSYYYPDFIIPKIVTLVTGMGTDIYISPSIIVIGLDYFLGEGASIRPHVPTYTLHTYQPNYIVPKIVLSLATSLNDANPTDITLLHDMLYKGKAYYFCKSILATVKEADIIGYTPAQWNDTKKHKKIVWEHFVDKELLYATSHILKNKYLSTRPFTAEIGPACPGNIGGWMGWEIVKKYMKDNPTTTLSQLMQDTDMQGLFIKSKYRP